MTQMPRTAATISLRLPIIKFQAFWLGKAAQRCVTVGLSPRSGRNLWYDAGRAAAAYLACSMSFETDRHCGYRVYATGRLYLLRPASVRPTYQNSSQAGRHDCVGNTPPVFFVDSRKTDGRHRSSARGSVHPSSTGGAMAACAIAARFACGRDEAGGRVTWYLW